MRGLCAPNDGGDGAIGRPRDEGPPILVPGGLIEPGAPEPGGLGLTVVVLSLGGLAVGGLAVGGLADGGLAGGLGEGGGLLNTLCGLCNDVGGPAGALGLLAALSSNSESDGLICRDSLKL